MKTYKIITLSPLLIDAYIHSSRIIERAIEKELIQITPIPLRDFGVGPRRNVDERAIGGNESPILRADVCEAALKSCQTPQSHIVLLSPSGKKFDHKLAKEFSKKDEIIFLCGRYGGFDERFIESYVHEEVSVGDFVLSGGELAALSILDASLRFVPDILGNPESSEKDSFEDQGLLEGPQYTKPLLFQGKEVPAVYLSGNHKAMAQEQRKQRLLKTAKKRPDLIPWAHLTKKEKDLISNVDPLKSNLPD